MRWPTILLAIPSLVLLFSPGVVHGHAHPAICVGKSGTVVVVHYAEKAGKVFICRSTDGGQTWSESMPVPGIEKGCTYPGALTTLQDGRMVVTWNWYSAGSDAKKKRVTQFAVSADEGKTWSAPRDLPESGGEGQGNRHPLLELAPNEWVFTLVHKTIVYDPQTEKVTPLGDGQNHGRRPLVRTPRGTLVSGKALRSTDHGKTWQAIKSFPPEVVKNEYRNDVIALGNGWLVAAFSDEEKAMLVTSRDDGLTWDMDHPTVFYLPGVGIRSRANPHLAQLDKDHLGIVFYEEPNAKPRGILFLRVPLSKLEKPASGSAPEPFKPVRVANLMER
jgi:hypothetical protein